MHGGWTSRVAPAAILAAAIALPAAAAPGSAASPAAEAPGGRQLYAAACASCHGADGRGAPLAAVGFAEPLPDFTDCSFATREPDADWFAVSHDGGPARAFGRMMPAFGEALSGAELQKALDHVRTFCADRSWPRGELNLPRALFTEKAFPEDEAVFTTTVDSRGGPGAVVGEVVYEKRLGARGQYEIVVPFAWREGVAAHAGESWVGGVGDLGLAVKRVLHHDLAAGRIWSAIGELKLPTGDEEEGFGKGTAIGEAFLAYGQILPADSFVQAQAGVEVPFEGGDAGEEAILRVALGKSFTEGRFGRTWSPIVEVLGARGLASGSREEWDLVPQLQVTLSRRQHVMANVGVRLPLDGSGEASQVLFYVLWDWFDGGLFDGW
ncbi:MAG TPA: cytochrome c [Thermoanaerobaculia bacterium]